MKGLETLLRLPGSQKVFCNGKLQNKNSDSKKKKKKVKKKKNIPPPPEADQAVSQPERREGLTNWAPWVIGACLAGGALVFL